MREILLLIWASVIPLFSQGQAEGDLGKIALSIMMPDNENEFDAGLLAKLESKIIQIVSAQGLAAVAYDHNFIIYPRLSLSEEDKVEGGMQSISVVSADLGLFIKQVEGNLIFSSLSVKLKGSGRDRQSAFQFYRQG